MFDYQLILYLKKKEGKKNISLIKLKNEKQNMKFCYNEEFYILFGIVLHN